MKEIIIGVKALLLFKEYDNGMDRSTQIAFGCLAWGNISIIIFGIIVAIN